MDDVTLLVDIAIERRLQHDFGKLRAGTPDLWGIHDNHWHEMWWKRERNRQYQARRRFEEDIQADVLQLAERAELQANVSEAQVKA